MKCAECGKALHPDAGFSELRRHPSGELEHFCSAYCLYVWSERQVIQSNETGDLFQ